MTKLYSHLDFERILYNIHPGCKILRLVKIYKIVSPVCLYGVDHIGPGCRDIGPGCRDIGPGCGILRLVKISTCNNVSPVCLYGADDHVCFCLFVWQTQNFNILETKFCHNRS